MRKILFFSSIFLIFGFLFFVEMEPALTGAATSANNTSTVSLTVDSEITMTGPADITMAPNISMSQDASIGSANIIIKTNDTDGYTLNIKSSTTPAMISTEDETDYFSDYSEASAGVPDAWHEEASSFEFGFSVFGEDVNNVSSVAWDNAGESSCGAADIESVSSNLNWLGLDGTNNILSAQRGATTTRSGATTTLCVAAEQGSSIFAPSGAYKAYLIATAAVQ